jgi:endonuclease/exonuclease/phosphatase family metal-dependent hydrolase
MVIVSWNMGCGAPSRYRRSHADAWAYLLDLQPDIAFVQEALRNAAPPRAHGSTFWSTNRGTESGTAVFVRRGVPAKRIALRSDGSYVSGVSVSSAGTPILLASVHVASGNYKEHRRVLTQTLARVTTGKRFVVGGDVNAARHWDEVYGGRVHTQFFKTLADHGFHDCHWAQHGREVQTFWGHQAREPYQCDHFFVDMQTARRGQIQKCVVVDTARVRALSDHGLLRLELTIDLDGDVITRGSARRRIVGTTGGSTPRLRGRAVGQGQRAGP